MTASTSPRMGITAAAAPVATAIGVFGVVYGAAARPILGLELTVLSSAVVFSGAAQFTMVAMLAAGATTASLLGAIAMLAVRHVPLGAVLRPHLEAGPGRRAILSWFLIDETAGLALTLEAPAERTLATAGGLVYTAWVAGTALGAAGAGVATLEPLAAALFPVLFVGLAALTITTRGDGLRAVAAGAATLALLLIWPGAGALGAIAVAVVAAAVVSRT